MIQRVSQFNPNLYLNRQLKNVNFKNDTNSQEAIRKPKWYEIKAKGDTIEAQRRNYSIFIGMQTLIIIALLATRSKFNIPLIFKRNNNNLIFESLKDNSTIPTNANCKSLNSELKKILDRIVNLDKMDKNSISEFGDESLEFSNRYMLIGPPGCGKSFFAKVLSKSIDAEYAEVLFSDVSSRWVGETEGNLKKTFESALKISKKNPDKKYVLTINEVDSLFINPENLNSSGGSHWVSVLRQRSIILNYLERLRLDAPNVIIVATTNVKPQASSLDNAALSRFQTLIEVSYPDKDCLYEALINKLSKFKNGNEFIKDNNKQLQELSEKMASRQFSFRNLEKLITDAKESYLNEKFKGSKEPFNIKFLQEGEKNIKNSDGELLKK